MSPIVKPMKNKKNKKLQRPVKEVIVQLPGETDNDYFKRCRAESNLLASCDYGVDEKEQDKFLENLGGDTENEGGQKPNI